MRSSSGLHGDLQNYHLVDVPKDQLSESDLKVRICALESGAMKVVVLEIPMTIGVLLHQFDREPFPKSVGPPPKEILSQPPVLPAHPN